MSNLFNKFKGNSHFQPNYANQQQQPYFYQQQQYMQQQQPGYYPPDYAQYNNGIATPAHTNPPQMNSHEQNQTNAAQQGPDTPSKKSKGTVSVF